MFTLHTLGLFTGGEEVGIILKPQSLNIGADLGINGHFPKYNAIRRSRGIEGE